MSGDPSDREEGVGYDDNDQGTAEASVEFHVVRSSRANFSEPEEVGTSQPQVPKKVKGKSTTVDASGRPDDRDIKASRCTTGFLEAVRATFGIPVEYQLSVIPEGKKLNDAPPKGTIMLTLEHLQSGIRFPISEQYKRLSNYFEVPLSQIHPNGVRHYSCFLELCRQTGVVDSMRLFCCLYLLSFKDRNHFAYIRLRGERKEVVGGLVTGITDSLRDFKEDYFQITHPTAFEGMVTAWQDKCYKPEKWFHTPAPLELADIIKLRDASPVADKAHADDLCPKKFFEFWKSSDPVNNIDVAKLASKKRKRPAARAATPAPPSVPKAAADATSAPRVAGDQGTSTAGIHVIPLRVQLPGGIDVPPTAEPVGDIPFVDLGSAETVVGPRRAEEVPEEGAPGGGGPSTHRPRREIPDLPEISSDTSTTAPGPQTITRTSFAEWVSRHNDGARATLTELPIAGDVARVTTLPIDLAHYKTHKPENMLAAVSSLCLQVLFSLAKIFLSVCFYLVMNHALFVLQAAQMSYLADQNANKNEVDLLLAKDLLLSARSSLRDAEKRAVEAERRASEGASLVASLENQLKESEDRRVEDLGVLESLRKDVGRLETEKAADKEDFSKQLADLTRRNELASKGLRDTVDDQKKKLEEATKRVGDAEAKVAESAAREEGLYEDFRKMLYVGEVQAGEYVRGRFGANVDVSDFKLDVLELHRRAKELPEDYDIPADIEDYLADDQGEGPN
ncbi:uncharacterized protein LOC126688337 isoform X2 [Mercurialis annua]|uniref:uncharacterized protein LOC126688337 isoform X2 n=1 Tax=Mercurialis annua TaxID=3986 RepID=UPI002160D396|nr:uncharacterized protein LOC126688337 isoform X2 [Mercurialis annua]